MQEEYDDGEEGSESEEGSEEEDEEETEDMKKVAHSCMNWLKGKNEAVCSTTIH